MATDFDVVVIGSVPEATSPLFEPAKLGMKAAIIERERSWRCLLELGLHTDQGAA